jgi:hypothetical protein
MSVANASRRHGVGVTGEAGTPAAPGVSSRYKISYAGEDACGPRESRTGGPSFYGRGISLLSAQCPMQSGSANVERSPMDRSQDAIALLCQLHPIEIGGRFMYVHDLAMRDSLASAAAALRSPRM